MGQHISMISCRKVANLMFLVPKSTAVSHVQGSRWRRVVGLIAEDKHQPPTLMLSPAPAEPGAPQSRNPEQSGATSRCSSQQSSARSHRCASNMPRTPPPAWLAAQHVPATSSHAAAKNGSGAAEQSAHDDAAELPKVQQLLSVKLRGSVPTATTQQKGTQSSGKTDTEARPSAKQHVSITKAASPASRTAARALPTPPTVCAEQSAAQVQPRQAYKQLALSSTGITNFSVASRGATGAAGAGVAVATGLDVAAADTPSASPATEDIMLKQHEQSTWQASPSACSSKAASAPVDTQAGIDVIHRKLSHDGEHTDVHQQSVAIRVEDQSCQQWPQELQAIVGTLHCCTKPALDMLKGPHHRASALDRSLQYDTRDAVSQLAAKRHKELYNRKPLRLPSHSDDGVAATDHVSQHHEGWMGEDERCDAPESGAVGNMLASGECVGGQVPQQNSLRPVNRSKSPADAQRLGFKSGLLCAPTS